jgi:hypothetical protein
MGEMSKRERGDRSLIQEAIDSGSTADKRYVGISFERGGNGD